MTELRTIALDRSPDAVTIAELVAGRARDAVIDYVRRQRWFGAKSRQVTSISVSDFGERERTSQRVIVDLLVHLQYADGADERYYLPLSAGLVERIPGDVRDQPGRAILLLETAGQRWLLHEAIWAEGFIANLVRQALSGGHVQMQHGLLAGTATAPPPRALDTTEVRLLGVEQSNTSALIGRELVLKAFRRLEPGTNPELEVSRFLTERTAFRGMPPLFGYLEYRRIASAADPPTLAIISQFIPNEGDGWAYTLGQVEQALAKAVQAGAAPASTPPIIGSAYLQSVQRLGQATASLHSALASVADDPDFCPEPIDRAEAERWASDAAETARQRIAQVAAVADRQRPEVRDRIARISQQRDRLLERFGQLRTLPQTGIRKIRLHGDFHLGQTLWTGQDFVIFDFEGEPAIPLTERRQKRPVLKDIAGMLRSFDYAAFAGGTSSAARTGIAPSMLAEYQTAWRDAARAAFLDAYLGTVRAAPVRLVPERAVDLDGLLGVFELEKAIYELAYEANNRPDWVQIPLTAVEAVLAARA